MIAYPVIHYFHRLYNHEESGRKSLGENWLQAIQHECKIIQEQRPLDAIDEPTVMVCIICSRRKFIKCHLDML